MHLLLLRGRACTAACFFSHTKCMSVMEGVRASERVQGWMCAKRFVLLQFTFGSGTSKKEWKSKITHGNYQQWRKVNSLRALKWFMRTSRHCIFSMFCLLSLPPPPRWFLIDTNRRSTSEFRVDRSSTSERSRSRWRPNKRKGERRDRGRTIHRIKPCARPARISSSTIPQWAWNWFGLTAIRVGLDKRQAQKASSSQRNNNLSRHLGVNI